MDEQLTPPPQGEIVEPMTFTEQITNLFASPGELFDNVRDTPSTASNWLVPLAIFIAVTIAMSQTIFHNPSLVGQYKDQVHQGIEKKLNESIQQGKMTPEQAEQAREMGEKFSDPSSPLAMGFQIGGIVIGTPIVLFLVALLYWLMGKTIIKAEQPYMKIVEVVGLTFFISTLESIVNTILVIGLDNIHASPGLGLAVMNGFSLDNKLHVILSKINIFTIWGLAVTGIGLGHLFQRDTPKVLVLVFARWILWIVFQLLSGMQFGG